MLPTIATSAKTYSSDAEKKKSEVRTGSCLCCLFASPRSRSTEPFEPQNSAAMNHPKEVERSNLFSHRERCIAPKVAEITSKDKNKTVMSTTSIPNLSFAFVYSTNRHVFLLPSNSPRRNHRGWRDVDFDPSHFNFDRTLRVVFNSSDRERKFDTIYHSKV
jgi:hypothetical protein